jgi:predicted nuclease of predicted toxin-antitoxin system
MRFLLDENLSSKIAQGLRDLGHDVLTIKESARGSQDYVILAIAQTTQRIVVTQDKDFGELAFHAGLPADCGVILFRLEGLDRDA